MITREDAIEADQVYKWCHDLEQSEAFQEIVLKEIEDRREEHDRCGTDTTKDPLKRAEHHMALKLARDLVGYGKEPGLVARRKAEALSVLQAWNDQHGEKLVALPDGKHL